MVDALADETQAAEVEANETRLPPGWRVVRLGEVCSLRAEAVHPTANGDKPYVGLEHLDPGNPRLARWGHASEVTSAKSRFYPRDVLYGKLRPYLDKAALTESDGICSTDILVLRSADGVSPDYLVHTLHTNAFVEFAISTTQGVNHPRTSWSAIARFALALPPLSEQRAIARVLRTVQEAREARRREVALERERKAALMQHLFTHGTRDEPRKMTEIGEMPESWRVDKLGRVATITSGGTPDRSKPEYWKGDIPWVKTGEINYNVITATEERISDRGLKYSSAKVVPQGTLLMAMYGQGITRGRVAILGIDAALNQACAAISPDDTVSTQFLYHYLAYSYERIRNLGHGANQKNLNALLIKSILIPIPALTEQRVMADALSTCDAEIAALEREATVLEEAFRALLEELMTGRVLVGH